MAFTVKTDTPTVVNNWPYEFQYIDDTDPLFGYLTPYAKEFRQIDVFIDELYEQRFLETATNEELEKLAAEVGVTRQAGENDKELRFRTRVRKLVSSSDGTADDIIAIMETAFEGKDLSNIDVEHDAGHPVIQFTMPQQYLDDIPLSQSEMNDELTAAFPAGFSTTIITGETFLFGSSGSQGLGNGELI